MNLRTIFPAMALALALVIPIPAARGGTEDLEGLLRHVPAELPIAIVVVDFEKLDKSIASLVKQIDPQASYNGALAEIKEDLGIGDWIDFSKPVAIANGLSGDEQIIMCVTVPNFAEKAKALPNAKEEEGVWHLTFERKEDVFATLKGPYVLMAKSAVALAAAGKPARTLAEELKPRLDWLKDRDALIHINFDPVRQQALAGIAQVATMGPLLAMAFGQHAGADPAGMTAMLSGVLDGLKRFGEQIAYVDVVLGLDANAANVTLASGFNDGPIKSYLAKQRPASVPPFTEIEERPYFAALGCHFPGTESPFLDYFFEKTAASVQPAAPPAAPGDAGTAATPPAAGGNADPAREAMLISRDLYRKVEGWNTVMSFVPGAMSSSGDYVGADPAAIFDLAKKAMLKVNPVLKSFNGGATYETLGSKKLGEVTVEEFALKFDAANPATAQMVQMMGENARFTLGIAGGRVRYSLGGEPEAQRIFSGKIEKPLGSSKGVMEAMATLPAKRNAVLLIDPLGLVPLLGPMMGNPKVDVTPGVSPVAISLSLSGEPARVDIRVPLKTIERLVQTLSPQKPM